MLPVLNPEQARAFDTWAATSGRLPTLLLMENAGRGVADLLQQRFGIQSKLLVVAGPGNNGGDGSVLARHWLARGGSAEVLLCSAASALKGDAKVAWAALSALHEGVVAVAPDEPGFFAALGAALARADVVVDALFGTGLSRDLSGPHAELVARLAAARQPVVALDAPSGLCAATGALRPVAVRAEVTATFGHLKLGLCTPQASAHVGELMLVGLGLPAAAGPALQPSARYLQLSDVRSRVPSRPAAAHKGQAGRVLVLAGAPGTTGAALLASQAALRAGAGLVTVATFEPARGSLDQRVLEVMTAPLDERSPEASLEAHLSSAGSVLVGPGWGTGEPQQRAIRHLLSRFTGPVVLDADAITLLATEPELLKAARARCLLTPHPGELSRLLGSSVAAVEADRFAALRRAVEQLGQWLLLKGQHTLVGGPEELPWVVSSGHRSLATAGSGDVLGGLIAALCTQVSLEDAALVGVAAHGLSARLWSARRAGADRGLLAHEIAECVPEVLAGLAGAAEALPDWQPAQY